MTNLDFYVEQVHSSDLNQVVDALNHLAGYSDFLAVSAIRNCFTHIEFVVRQAAIQAAASRLDPCFFDPLLSLLDDPQPEVRLETIQVLGKYAEKGLFLSVSQELLKRPPEPETAEAARHVLLRAGSTILPLLETELLSGDQSRCERAIEILPFLDVAGANILLTHILELPAREAYLAAETLGNLNLSLVDGYFLGLMKSENADERRIAIHAILTGPSTDQAILTAGMALLNDPDEFVRLDAAFYLGATDDPLAEEMIKPFDPRRETGPLGYLIKRTIRRARLRFEFKKHAIHELHETLFTGNDEIKIVSTEELKSRKDPISIPFLTEALRIHKTEEALTANLDALGMLNGVEAIDEILSLLENGLDDQNEKLVHLILGKFGHPKALPILKSSAGKRIPRNFSCETGPVNAARLALRQIRKTQSDRINRWYMPLDASGFDRLPAAIRSGMQADPRGVDLLIKAYKAENLYMNRIPIIRALGLSGSGMVLPFLIENLKSTDVRLSWFFVLAIGQLPLPKAPSELIALILDSNPQIRTAVLFALGRLKDQATLPILLRRLEDEDVQVRAVALLALGHFPFSDAWLSNLELRLFDPSLWVRLETARLLARELKIPSRESLMHMLVDDHPEIRFLATTIAWKYLDNDLRPALEQSASMKGGRAPGKAKEILEQLRFRQVKDDPVRLQQFLNEETIDQGWIIPKEKKQKMRAQAQPARREWLTAGWVSRMETDVVGSSYVDWEVLFPRLAIGDRIYLKREPKNPRDPKAILVLDGAGNKLGYLPKPENKHLAQDLDQGLAIQALILELIVDKVGTYLRIEIFEKPDHLKP